MSSKRGDISPFIVHLTRDYNGDDAKDNLLSILTGQCIEARNPYGAAVRHLEEIDRATDEALETQLVTCFSETPPHELHGLISPGIWRRYNFRPYGVAFSRSFVLKRGGNAVWYLNSYRGTHEWLVKDVNALIDTTALAGGREAGGTRFAQSRIARLTPFMEVIGEWYGVKKDFTFEREWRHSGDFHFALRHVKAVIVPPGEEDEIRAALERDLPPDAISGIPFVPLTEAAATSGDDSPLDEA